MQLKQLKDTEKREKYRIYGELLNTYGYELTGGEKSFTCLNYYTNEEITIPLDTQLSAKDNAKKHFDKYNKLKRTYEALTDLTKETKAEIDHLESISSALDIALAENDLVQIKEELMEYGYIKNAVQATRSRKSPASPSTTFPPTASTFTWERTTTRMRNSPSSWQQATTGGSTPKASPAPMSS